jgi:DNA-binding transcriptional ArsR family regulator
MADSVKQNFDPSDVELSRMARSIAHPIRIMILRKLAETNAALGSEEIKAMPMAPSTVIQHLRDLKKAGLVKGKIFGSNAKFWLVQEQLERIIDSWTSISELLHDHPEKSRKQ